MQGGIAVPISCLHVRALLQEQEDERKVAVCCRGDERRGPSGIAGFDIRSAVEQHLDSGRSAFGEGRMDRLFRVDNSGDWLCPFLDGTSIADGPASANHKEDGAGHAGAVVQATHGSPKIRVWRLLYRVYGLAYSLVLRHQQLLGGRGRIEGVKRSPRYEAEVQKPHRWRE